MIQTLVGFLILSSTAFAGTELKLNSGTILTNANQVQRSQITSASTNNEWIVQFKNHVRESDKALLRAHSLKIHSYLPEDAFLVRGPAAQALSLKQNQNIQAVLPFEAQMKLSPTLGAANALMAAVRETILVTLFSANDSQKVQSQIQKLGTDVVVQKAEGISIFVSTLRGHFSEIAAVAGVENVQAYVEMVPMQFSMNASDVGEQPKSPGDYTDLNGFETGTKVMNFDAAWAAGFMGQEQIAGMADTGLDSGDANNIHQDFKASVKSGYAVGMFGKSWADPMGHGTHVAGSVLGRGTASSGKLKGGAYAAYMVAQGMWSPILNNLSPPASLTTMFDQAYKDGARVHTNSWGAPANLGAYEKNAASVDEAMFAKQDLLVVFAAGNSGIDKNKDGRVDSGSVSTPATSKNALAVGASENLLAVGGIQKLIKDLRGGEWGAEPMGSSTVSDNINGMAMFSSRGPTLDGRIKPDIVAPGTNIVSVRSQQPTAEPLWGAYNNDYVYSGGTSMAAPLAAGAAVVTRQILIQKLNQPAPSAALLKAYLMHTAFDMFPGQYGAVGEAKGQELLTPRPNSDEGFGRIDMAKAVNLKDTAQLLLIDSKAGVATGEMLPTTFKVTKAGRLQVTLVWTDAPGSANASKALVNDLDLEVVLPDGKIVSANDAINNTSYIQGQTAAGDIIVKVKGVNVPMGIAGKQPFALVATVE
ncbi:MAG: S8 family serine peptidase [Bdellovibrionaceae bacterium]|nr:S8 family serine peptidase [Bdellovibrio sp.]